MLLPALLYGSIKNQPGSIQPKQNICEHKWKLNSEAILLHFMSSACCCTTLNYSLWTVKAFKRWRGQSNPFKQVGWPWTSLKMSVIVWASHRDPGVSVFPSLSAIQIFWSVFFLYTFVTLTDLMGCRCGWLRLSLKELHIHVSRHVTTQLPCRLLWGDSETPSS